MRKSLLNPAELEPKDRSAGTWLDLTSIAQVQVTSEDPDFPVESAFSFGKGPGWRAGVKGTQTIRLVFDRPQRLRRLWLRFDENGIERTQEFALRWSGRGETPGAEIVRQQWNFSPGGPHTEIEDYAIDLRDVLSLELRIDPDLGRREAFASLTELRIG